MIQRVQVLLPRNRFEKARAIACTELVGKRNTERENYAPLFYHQFILKLVEAIEATDRKDGEGRGFLAIRPDK